MSPDPGGEESFLTWLRERAPATDALEVSVGDDGAVWRCSGGERLVAVADSIAEGSHFAADCPPELIGRKALAVNLSDIAAMGAEPLFAVATATLPTGFAPELPQRLHQGISELADRFRCPLIGGDTTSHEGGLVLSVSVVGTLGDRPPLLRSGAAPGDRIAITGRLGGSFASGRHLSFEPRLEEARALRALGPPSALMDLSDGLLLDFWRLADASGVGFELDLDAVPLHEDALEGERSPEAALADGEDFELVFCASEAAFERIEREWSLPTPITAIGRVLEGPERVLRSKGRTRKATPRGFEHR